MTDPRFVPVDLTEMQDEGVLFTANERFFWPLGLALTWDHDKETGKASNLHIREWQWRDGHHERIEDSSDDLARVRQAAFTAWVVARGELT